MSETLTVGVIGVGSMGQHHARIYNELPRTDLVGVFDVDDERAAEVASEYETNALERDALLQAVDAVSVVVPTQYHYETVMDCLDAGVAVFVEKPVLEGLERADEFRSRVRRADVPVQVGHVERFNPAVQTLEEIVSDLSIVSIRALRLGPPPERTIEDSATIDLMIHDIDIVLSLLDSTPVSIQSTGVDGNRHASALLEFDRGTMAALTASRKTQRKVRRLEITAEECFVEVDYLDQSIEIHRGSFPEYIEENGDVRFKHESIVERPSVPTGEPLRNELASFVETAAENGEPAVTVEDGLDALSVALEIEETALESAKNAVVADD